MPDVQGSKWEILNYFREFMEDYNTATMPHEKFYNYDAWELKEHQRKQDKKEKKRLKVQETFNDEEERRLELQRERELKEHTEFQQTVMLVQCKNVSIEYLLHMLMIYMVCCASLCYG